MGLDVVNLYGCREAGGIARNGVVYEGVDVRVLCDGTTDTVKDSGTGEIVVHSPRLAAGYLRSTLTDSNSSSKHDDSFFMVDGKLFFRTGDLGTVVPSKHRRLLSIIGRAKAAFKTASGVWQSSASIENVLELHSMVLQAFVFMRNQEGATPGIVGVIVMNKAPLELADQKASARDLTLHCIAHSIPLACTPTAYCFLPPSERFTMQNGLLTSSLKKAVGALTARFASPNYLNQFIGVDSDPKGGGTQVALHHALLPYIPRELPRSQTTGLSAAAVDVTLPLSIMASKMSLLGLESLGAVQLYSAMPTSACAQFDPDGAVRYAAVACESDLASWQFQRRHLRATRSAVLDG